MKVKTKISFTKYSNWTVELVILAKDCIGQEYTLLEITNYFKTRREAREGRYMMESYGYSIMNNLNANVVSIEALKNIGDDFSLFLGNTFTSY